MQQNQWKGLAAAVVALIAVFLLGSTLRKGCTRTERYIMANANVDIAVVTKMAQEVAAKFDPGKVVLIRYTGYIPGTIQLQEALVAACERELGRDWTVVELPPADFGDANHGNWALRTGGGAWGNEIKAWMQPHLDAVAIISMVGVPHLPEAEWQKLPPFFGSIPFPDDYTDAAMEAGMIGGLAVMREDANPVTIRNFRGSPEALFDLAYEWLTPASRQ